MLATSLLSKTGNLLLLPVVRIRSAALAHRIVDKGSEGIPFHIHMVNPLKQKQKQTADSLPQ
jgi:hypothetical protein